MSERDGDIKPIQTRYKGYRFRSRMEARWAVYFDALEIQWQFEREGFDLPTGKYLPDFWLPQVRMWAEVKPKEFTSTEYRLIRELAKATEFPVLKLIGPPESKAYYAVEKTEGIESDYAITNMYLDEHRFYSSPGDDLSCFDEIRKAVDVARSARFEHGETP